MVCHWHKSLQVGSSDLVLQKAGHNFKKNDSSLKVYRTFGRLWLATMIVTSLFPSLWSNGNIEKGNIIAKSPSPKQLKRAKSKVGSIMPEATIQRGALSWCRIIILLWSVSKHAKKTLKLLLWYWSKLYKIIGQYEENSNSTVAMMAFLPSLDCTAFVTEMKSAFLHLQ